jgi:enterochelin esterase-like enzyme
MNFHIPIHYRFAASALALAGILFSAAAQTQSLPAKGTVQRIKVHGKSLEGNLEGDSPDREVSIYLPPRYDSESTRHYPAIYLLHGYFLTDQYWTGTAPSLNIPGVKVLAADVPAAMDEGIAKGTLQPMIVVMPNAYTKYAGSMYSSSATTGDWESYIAEDLVAYVDSHYRTIRNRLARGLVGHSMGGYGAVRIGMKRPDVFASLYIMSACCLMDNPVPPAPPAPPAPPTNSGQSNAPPVPNPFAQVTLARAAAWSPNPTHPPEYLDMPTKDGQPQPLVIAKWAANSPLAMIDQYVSNLKKYHAIGGDVGLQDGLSGANRQMDQAFRDYGIKYEFQTYEGDHTNKIPERMGTTVLPFFSKNLTNGGNLAASGKGM